MSLDRVLGKRERRIGFAAFGISEQTLDRDPAIAEAIDFVREQKGDGREKAKIAALWTGTGGGKTHLLDSITKRCDAENIPAIVINFNGVHNLSRQEIENPEYSLVARFLYCAFNFDCPWPSFLFEFFRQPAHVRFSLGGGPLTLLVSTFREICEWEGNIFIGVDELIKVPRTHLLVFFDELKALVDAGNGRIKLAVSTLDCAPFDHEVFGVALKACSTPPTETLSKRGIRWLKLPPIQAEKVLAEWKEQPWCAKRLDTVQWLISLCGGHPRAIAFLRQVLEAHADGSETASSLYGMLLGEMNVFSQINIPAIDVVLESIALTLTSSRVAATDSIKGERLASLIACSWVIGEAAIQDLVLVRLSPLALNAWVDSTASACANLNHPIVRTIQKLLLPPEPSDSTKLEQYHLRMEVLRGWALSLLRGGSSEFGLSLSDWYGDGSIAVNNRQLDGISFGYGCAVDKVNNPFFGMKNWNVTRSFH